MERRPSDAENFRKGLHGDGLRLVVVAVFEGQTIAFVLARRKGLFKPVLVRSDIAHTDVGRWEKHFA